MNYWPSQSSRLIIRITSPAPVHKKQNTSSMGGKKSKTASSLEATLQTMSKTSSTLKTSSIENTLAKLYNTV